MRSRETIGQPGRKPYSKPNGTPLKDQSPCLTCKLRSQRFVASISVELLGPATKARDVLNGLVNDLPGDLRAITCVVNSKDDSPKENRTAPKRARDESLKRAKSTSGTVIRVSRWEDLGIGIDEDGTYLAVTPCPPCGAVFPKREAVEVPLPGEQWRQLLDLLARSENGNTALKKDVIGAFGYAIVGNLRADQLEELRGDSRKMHELNQERTRLRQASSNLSRRLRKQIAVEHAGSTTALSVAKPGVVQAGFVVRHLVRDGDGKLRFGRDASQEMASHLSSAADHRHSQRSPGLFSSSQVP